MYPITRHECDWLTSSESLEVSGVIVSVASRGVETTQDKTKSSIRGDEILACLATNPFADKRASVTLLARLRRLW
jgi:hypothetical protein